MTSTTSSTSTPPLSGQFGPEWAGTTDHQVLNRPLNRPWAERGALAALLVAAGLLYVWDLGSSGYANDFYAAAVQAGTKSWKAFFFGSFDSANAITVDKPPAALWPMELSGRIFGFNSWSMLVPQAIEGVLTVWLLYATVRRWFGHGAGLIAGALLAVTPVAVLMFRFNNPDALMTLLVVVAAYCTTRAIENGSTRWLLLAGGVMGFSFLAKGLQPFTVLPALAIAYLVCAPTSLRRRLLQLVGAGAALIVGAGWWVLAVDLTPASDRPYIGGSGDNSALGLAFGYNGIDRLSTTGNGPGGGFSGATGLGRLFNSLNGGQISWLLPTALIAALATVVVAGHRPRTDRTYAALILWGGWLVVTGAVLSFAGGIIHTYYSVELAPAVAAVVAIGAVSLWRARSAQAARVGLALAVAATGVWAYELLRRTSNFHPWLAYLVIAAGLVSAALLLVPSGGARRALVVTSAVAGAVALGGGPVAYALDTASTPQTGSVPSAGPTVQGTGGFGGPGGTRGGFPGGTRGEGFGGAGGFPGGTQGGPGGTTGGTTGGFPGGPGGTTGGTTGATTGGTTGGTAPGGTTGGTAPGGTTGGARTGGFGGGTANAALTALLKKTTTTWAAATIGSQSAGPLELASGKAVIAIGGFSGSDPAPTLAQFQKLVAEHKIAYFVSGGGFGGGGGRGGQGTGSQISTWVAAHYTSTTVGGSTVYDLSKATS